MWPFLIFIKNIQRMVRRINQINFLEKLIKYLITCPFSGSDRDMCRICHCEGDHQLPLISPCFCSGSLKFVHQACLQQWIKSSDTKCCELCKFEFIMNTKLKPFTKVSPFSLWNIILHSCYESFNFYWRSKCLKSNLR